MASCGDHIGKRLTEGHSWSDQEAGNLFVVESERLSATGSIIPKPTGRSLDFEGAVPARPSFTYPRAPVVLLSDTVSLTSTKGQARAMCYTCTLGRHHQSYQCRWNKLLVSVSRKRAGVHQAETQIVRFARSTGVERPSVSQPGSPESNARDKMSRQTRATAALAPEAAAAAAGTGSGNLLAAAACTTPVASRNWLQGCKVFLFQSHDSLSESTCQYPDNQLLQQWCAQL